MTAPPHDGGAFLRLPPEMSDAATSRVMVLPIPYEASTSYLAGTERGPAAIIEASEQVEWYDESRCDEPCREGIHTLPAIDCEGTPPEVISRIRDEVARHASAGRFVLSLGGEHTVTVGCVEGAAQSGPLTVVQIDAHADLRDEYHGSKWSHGCVMRRLSDRFQIVQIGIRSMSAGEAEYADGTDGIMCIQGRHVAAARREKDGSTAWIDKAIQSIGTERVYLTIDLDGLDPSVIPAVGTPEPGGLLWHETLAFVRTLFESRKVVAADIVELCPLAGSIWSDFASARLAYKVAGHAIRVAMEQDG